MFPAGMTGKQMSRSVDQNAPSVAGTRADEAMAQAYPYLDLTVLPQMRDHVVSSRAAIIFTFDLARVLWSNGEGAQLIGATNIRRALEGDYRANPGMMRQIAVAARRIDGDGEARSTIRTKSSFSTRLVGIAVSELALPDGGQALLMISDELHGRQHNDQAKAQAAVDGLDGYSHASAVLDADGMIVAHSQHFEALEISNNELTALVQEVAKESDRLVKRRVPTNDGEKPAGIARVSDDPALHLVVVAEADDIPGALTAEPAKPNPKTAPLPSTERTEQESASPTAFGGQFTSRREKPGRNRLKRWYYKTDEPEEPEEIEFSPPEEPVSPIVTEPAAPDPIEGPQPAADVGDDTSLTARLNRVELTSEPGVTNRPHAETPEKPSANEVADPESKSVSNFQFRATAKPVRFVWEMDTTNTFVSVSGELADAVGPDSAAVTGTSWDSVGQSRGFQNTSDISALLEKGDTWSGKTVLWPVQGTDLRVPIDLAGLPSFDRNRSFSGFTGFGIIRAADAIIDPEGGGLEFGSTIENHTQGQSDDFGPETGPEEPHPVQQHAEPKVVDIGTRRSVHPERELSSGEQNAFDEIAQKLSSAGLEKPDHEERKSNEIKSPEPNSYTPSAFANRFSDTDPVKKTGRDASENDVDTSILARLPIPVLVYRSNDMLFGNDDFFQLTGYADLSDLSDQGGVNALFGLRDSDEEGEEAVIYHRDGSQLDVSAHLQRVPWDDQRAMLLTLRRNGGGPGDQQPFPDGSEDNEGLFTGDPDEGDSSPEVEDTRPSVRDASPIVLDLGGREAVSTTDNSLEAKAAAKPPLSDVPTDSSAPGKPDTLGNLTSEDMLSILDVSTDGILILGEDGTMHAINRSAEALFDIKPNYAEGKSITKLLAPESHRVALDYLSGMTGTGVASLLNDGREVIGQTAKGGLIPLFMAVGKLEKTNAYCAVMRDITQFKKTEEDLVTAKAQAESANALKSDFLTKISHEIRTPLNAIIGFSDLMIAERFGRIDNDRYRGYLRDIRRSGNHVLDLINDLLDISKIESGKVDLDFDACDLNAIVSESVAMTQPSANKQRIIIRTSLSGMVPKVVADPRSIRQVVLNIVSNSIKYTRQGGQVIVSTVYDENGEVVLRIRDTGVGMNDLELARAMKPFQQVGSVREEHNQGTGLGLPLTKALVEANRARFKIESQPGEGTLVEIHFPIQRVLADR